MGLLRGSSWYRTSSLSLSLVIQAGFYFGVSQVPLFLPKLISGVLSGNLLSRYCPPTDVVPGCEDGWLMWVVIGLMSLPFPFLVHCAICRGWILDPAKKEVRGAEKA